MSHGVSPASLEKNTNPDKAKPYEKKKTEQTNKFFKISLKNNNLAGKAKPTVLRG